MNEKKSINQITEDDIIAFELSPTLERYQAVATKSAIYPGQGKAIGLMYATLKLNGEAGELAEHVGKAMRDDNYGCGCQIHMDGSVSKELIELTSQRHALLIKEAGDVLWYLSAICNELGISLELVASMNLNKLKDRTDRQKLQGSGDER